MLRFSWFLGDVSAGFGTVFAGGLRLYQVCLEVGNTMGELGGGGMMMVMGDGLAELDEVEGAGSGDNGGNGGC